MKKQKLVLCEAKLTIEERVKHLKEAEGIDAQIIGKAQQTYLIKFDEMLFKVFPDPNGFILKETNTSSYTPYKGKSGKHISINDVPFNNSSVIKALSDYFNSDNVKFLGKVMYVKVYKVGNKQYVVYRNKDVNGITVRNSNYNKTSILEENSKDYLSNNLS